MKNKGQQSRYSNSDQAFLLDQELLFDTYIRGFTQKQAIVQKSEIQFNFAKNQRAKNSHCIKKENDKNLILKAKSKMQIDNNGFW